MTLSRYAVTLDFDGASKKARSLSGVAATDDYLFLAPDEGSTIVRMRRTRPGTYSERTTVALRELFPQLPGAAADELDLEGIDLANGYLWILGSHSSVRTKADSETPLEKVPELLAQVEHPASRQVLIRLAIDTTAGTPEPAHSGTSSDGARTSAILGDGPDGLRAALAGDEHLKSFLEVPGKDNGLDLEGLAVLDDGRVLLGLRGPVLRGWAVILELRPQTAESAPHDLELAAVPGEPEGRRYRKHFLNLDGLGIRDLAADREDLLILTGPTMDLDGPAKLQRLSGGAIPPLPTVITSKTLKKIEELPVDDGHPEAITVLDHGQLLVCHDSPTGQRSTRTTVLADLVDPRG